MALSGCAGWPRWRQTIVLTLQIQLGICSSSGSDILQQSNCRCLPSICTPSLHREMLFKNKRNKKIYIMYTDLNQEDSNTSLRRNGQRKDRCLCKMSFQLANRFTSNTNGRVEQLEAIKPFDRTHVFQECSLCIFKGKKTV